MILQQAYIINSILMVIDAMCVIAAGYAAYFIRIYISPTYFGYQWSMETQIFVGSVMGVMFINNYVLGRLNLYSESRPMSYLDLLWSIFSAILIDFAVISAAIFILQMKLYSRLFLALFAVQSFIFISTARILAQFYFDKVPERSFNARKILIVADSVRGELVEDVLKKQVSWGHKVIGRLSVKREEDEQSDTLGNIDDLSKCLQKYTVDEVLFALDGDRSVDLMKSLDLCRKIGVSFRILPSLWVDMDQFISVETFQNVPFLTIQIDQFDAVGLVYKRILDLIGGLVGMVLLCLITPFIAIAIKLDSEGPVIFKQKRVGQRGRIFYIYKFRSMCQESESLKEELMEENIMNGAIFKLEDDPRITRVGKWLRKTSIDEMPQLFNVLKGEMSLVGTRPPTMDEVEMYQYQQLRRIAAKPGITGMWQISGRNKITDFDKIVELDCKYLDQWSFWGDMKILLKTVIILLQREGAM